ncbi:MAG: NYN domain-containing protein [Oscillospiraceae bacterium]
MNDEKRFAILIDGENISAGYIKIILDEISTKGIATYKRIYGDWTKPGLAKWKDILLAYSITPMQQYSYTYGKNASDSAMIIDAMDILYSGKVEGFCLATSDSDFTKLASRLRESGMEVVGMGEEKTPRPFVAACNEFKFVDKLLKEAELAEEAERAAAKAEAAKAAEPPEKGKSRGKKAAAAKKETAAAPSVPSPAPAPQTSQTSFNTIRSTIVAIIKDKSDDDGYMPVSDVGSILSKRYADFDVRNYSFKKMVPFLKSMGLFEVKKVPDPKSPNSQIAYVRLKEGS